MTERDPPGAPPEDREPLPTARERRVKTRFGLLLLVVILAGLLWAALRYLQPGQEPVQVDRQPVSLVEAGEPPG